MNLDELIERINEIELQVQHRTQAYFMDSDCTSIIDKQLNGYLRAIKAYCKSNNLLSFIDQINELFPIEGNAIEFFCFWDGIKDSLQASQSVFSGIDRIKLIQRIAIKLQGDLTKKNIDAYLCGFGILVNQEEEAASKRVYVEELLAEADGLVILKIADDLGLISDGVVETEIENILSDKFIREQIRKCHVKINIGDFDGAITNARTLMEGILMSIEESILGVRQQYDGKLEPLYKRVSKLLNMYPEDPKVQSNLNQILRGFLSIINGFSGISNNIADRHATAKHPQRHHAVLAVNSAFTICNFLLQSFNYQKVREKK